MSTENRQAEAAQSRPTKPCPECDEGVMEKNVKRTVGTRHQWDIEMIMDCDSCSHYETEGPDKPIKHECRDCGEMVQECYISHEGRCTECQDQHDKEKAMQKMIEDHKEEEEN